MRLISTAVLCLIAFLTLPEKAWSGGRVFALPSGGSDIITVLDSDDLSIVSSFPATTSVVDVLASADGQKYYVVSRSSTDTVIVLDADSLNVLKRISIGSSAFEAEITPDGRYLLIAAGLLRVIRTDTDEQVGSGIPVGGGPTQIVVDNTSTKAYVLADRGDVIAVIDLDTMTVLTNLEVPNSASIALTPNDARLLAVFRDGLRQFRTTDLEEIDTIDSDSTISNGRIFPLPNSTEAFVLNRSGGPLNNSQLFNLDLRTVKTVGDAGAFRLNDVRIISNEKAIGILSSTRELVDIDLTATPDATGEVLDFGQNSENLATSPNNRLLFLSSLSDSSITKVDAVNNRVLDTAVVPISPSGHAVVFQPSELPPAQITVNGGDNQFVPPGRTLPVAISVKVIDSEDTPIAGLPVLFAAEGSPVDVTIETPHPSITNSRGIASAVVTIPDLPEEEEEEALQPAPEGEIEAQEAPAAAGEEPPTETEVEVLEASAESPGDETIDQANLAEGVAAGPEVQELQAPDSKDQQVDLIDPIIITARTSGLEPAIIQANLIRGTGLIKVGGDFQVTSPLRPFPEPFTILATDQAGDPLPPDTLVDFTAFLARCDNGSEPVPTDPNGFASVECLGETISGVTQPGSITAQLPDFLQFGSARFTINVAQGAEVLSVEKRAGDNQTAPTGTTLPQPLQFLVTSGFVGGVGEVGVRVRQISGPPALISPTFIVARAFVLPEPINVTLGPNAGNIQIQVEVLSINKPSVVFNITATGGQPASFQKVGDGQSARIGREIATPLRMRVINESGGVVAFPNVTWTVVEGDATLIAASDPDGATARVVMGDMPGPVVVRASIASLVATFNLTATPPEPVSISTVSGQNQILTVGAISEPLIVQVNEIGEMPATNVMVGFSGPEFVILHPLDDSTPGNPVQQQTDPEGRAGVRVELPQAAAALLEEGGGVDQFSSTITILATVGENLTTTFALGTRGRTPVFEAAGVVNAATFQPGLVPGSLATLFGQGLSEGIVGTELAGGATSFQGTTVRIGGIQAPLLSVTGPPAEQINLQVPFQLSTGQTTSIQIENNGTSTVVSGIPVFSTQPGIFEIPLPGGGTIGAVIHASNGQLVTEQNPAARGEPLSLFFTGGGAVQPSVDTGVLGPIPPALMTQDVVVGFDDQGAEVLFKGYAPGFLGLYQVNFVMPESAACGVRTLVVRVGGATSERSTTALECP